MSMGKRPDWSRRLPRRLTIPTVMNLTTLADVRSLLGHLPAHTRHKATSQHVAAQLDQVARSGDTIDVAIALRIACALDGVPCRQK